MFQRTIQTLGILAALALPSFAGSNANSTTNAASGGSTITSIDQIGGWENCGACAGIGGHGPVVSYSMKQHVGSPSMDGQSAQFWIGGGKKYANALWWKQLGPRPTASHFTYDLYFYLQNPKASQALEFDMNQSVNGRKYILGTECGVNGSHQWDVWDTANHHWVRTGIPCTNISAYKWHHLTIEAERVGAKTHFISFTLDGKKSYANRYFNTYATRAKELNVAVQLDTTGSATAYSMWVDKISLNYR
jgi:hypothetical protein